MLEFVFSVIANLILNYPFAFIIWMFTGFKKDKFDKIVKNGFRLNSLIISGIFIIVFLLFKLIFLFTAYIEVLKS